MQDIQIRYIPWSRERRGFPAGSKVKNLLAVQEPQKFPGSGRSPAGGHVNPLQYSCLENPKDRGAWQATVHRVAKSCTQLRDWATLTNTGVHVSLWIMVFSRYMHRSGISFPISSVQFSHSVMSYSLRPHGLQQGRPPCPLPTPRVYSNSCPLSRWCHPTISSFVIPFSSCL